MAEKPNTMITDKSEIPADLLTDEQVKAFFDAHKASRTTMVADDEGNLAVISKSAKSVYNSWLWTQIGIAHSNAKRLHALEIKKHDEAKAVPSTGFVKQAVKARGKAKQGDDEALHSAMMDAVLAELVAKGVDVSVLND